MNQRQLNVLRAIRDYWTDHGFAPSLRDLQLACDIPSTSSVAYSLTGLRNKGLIVREGITARSTRLTKAGEERAG